MKLRPTALSWNPIEAFTFVAASDDYKYSYYKHGVIVLFKSVQL